MRFTWFQSCSRLGAVALVGLTGLVAQGADEGKEEVKEQPPASITVEKDVLIEAPRQVIVSGPNQRGVIFAQARLSEYWLGLNCMPMLPALRAQLKLDEGQGLLVENVMPESPAGKAGFKQHDVLVSAGEKPLKDLPALISLIDENKDKELTFQLIRGGEKMTLTVKPEKRPEAEGPVQDRFRWATEDGEKAIEVLRERLEKAGTPMRMQIFHPGMVVPGSIAVTAKFPKDLHVHITKHGEKPVEIVVERGEKRWTVTEEKLADLPDDVRPHVEALLGRMSLPQFDVEIEEGAAVPGVPALPFNVPLPPPGEISERLEKRLDEMTRRMEQMREQLQDLREERRENRSDRREDREERRFGEEAGEES